MDRGDTSQIKIVTTEEELRQAFQIRHQVFVEEQHVPKELELDSFDQEATHFLALQGDFPIGTCRMRWIDPHTVKAERVAVLKEKRSTGVGKKLMQELEAHARVQGAKTVLLESQIRVESFYHKLGYVSYGSPFEVVGIPHIKMRKTWSN